MVKSRIIWLMIALALVLSRGALDAQNGAASGLYRITSGQYSGCSGFVWVPPVALPYAGQAFIELNIDRDKNLAQMKILAEDMKTVFRDPLGGFPPFPLSLSNGVVFPDHIQFGVPQDPEGPVPPFYYYLINNSADVLHMNGVAYLRCSEAGDMQHTNVTAILMSTTTIRFSEVEVCWSATSNRTYQVQYRSELTTNMWADLGPPVAGTGPTNCVTDKISPGEPKRFFRVLTLP